MKNNFEKFANTARYLSRNPLGIIALFILLVYGLACLVLGLAGTQLEVGERSPLIWFIVIFPVIVLLAFCWLVAKHHHKLYAPGDFENEELFVAGQSAETVIRQTSSNDYQDLMKAGEGFQVVSENEDLIKKDLLGRGLESDSDTAKVLIRHLAVAQSNLWFETVSHTIFGSQIQLLKHLNETRTKVTFEFLENYFNSVRGRFAELAEWSTERYLAFLINYNLIIKHETNLYELTVAGNEFLMIMAKSGTKDNNPL